MSSYNENLHASVVNYLQAQELKLDNTQAQLNASMFTLYYAEDATITSQEKLEKTEATYKNQEKTKEEAVDNNNLATNLLASANQEKQTNLQSVSNAAVSAANVQIATNAIVNLASDMGSIVSILNAADYGSQIYEQAISVNKLMNDTAYNAEVTSQLAMDASSLTAEITASTVADLAASTASSMTNLLGVLNTQLETTTALESAENASYAAAATDEKKAEGSLVEAKVEYDAANDTYMSSIKELNLNLQVIEQTNSSFTVQFNPYLNPFYNSSPSSIIESPYNVSPVENYYVFVVKESDKSTFSLTVAEGLLSTPEIAFKIKGKQTTTTAISKKILLPQIKDINNNDIMLGESYVVFVLAQFTIDYKKSLNNFDDFLTAASSNFTLKTPLMSPSPATIKVDLIANEQNTSKTQALQFTVNEPNSVAKVEYRCMFLLNNTQEVNSDFQTESLSTVENQILTEINSELNKIKEEDQLIDNFNNQNLINTLNTELQNLIAQKVQATQNEAGDDTDDDSQSKNAAMTTNDFDDQINEITTRIQSLQSNSSQNSNESSANSVTSGPNMTPKPGFFFNQLIAENITNYYVPTAKQITTNGSQVSVSLEILDNTTDNFGNPLIPGKKYTPVILSVASGFEKLNSQFANAISDFKNTTDFTYSSTNN